MFEEEDIRPKITLRPYQEPAVNKGVQFFQNPKGDPSIIVMPTAAGKSIVIAKIVDGCEGKTLILQPTKELLAQNYEKYRLIGGRASIYSASFNSKYISPVTYATIGSIKEIGLRFRAHGFKQLLIDEVHLYPRSSDSMLGKFLNDSGIERVLGLTATALKLQTNMGRDGQPFSKLVMLTARSKHGNFFKHIIHTTQISEMTEGGFWSPLIYDVKEFDSSALKFNSTKADYTEESLKRVYYSNRTEEHIMMSVSQLTDRKHILIFVPTIADAQRLAGRITGAKVVYSGMNDKERDSIVSGFKQGRIKVVVNVNILATGFDMPQLDAIIMARPTASLAMYYQQLGRLTRIHPDKKDGLIIDYSGNVKKFGRIEHLKYVQQNGYWKLVGEGEKILTGVALHEVGSVKLQDIRPANGEMVMPFGKHEGKPISQLPKSYRDWMLKEFKWTDKNHNLKHALLTAATKESK